MTPATEPNRDNHFPVDFPWERQEEGGLFNISLDAPEGQCRLHRGDPDAGKVEMAQYYCSLLDFCVFFYELQIKYYSFSLLYQNQVHQKTEKRQDKITRFCGFIHIYSTNIHFLFVTEVQFTDLSSNSSYTLIYIIIRHFRISVTSLSTSFIHLFLHMYTHRYNIAIQTCLIFIISQNKSVNLFSWLTQPLGDMFMNNI